MVHILGNIVFTIWHFILYINMTKDIIISSSQHENPCHFAGVVDCSVFGFYHFWLWVYANHELFVWSPFLFRRISCVFHLLRIGNRIFCFRLKILNILHLNDIIYTWLISHSVKFQSIIPCLILVLNICIALYQIKSKDKIFFGLFVCILKWLVWRKWRIG